MTSKWGLIPWRSQHNDADDMGATWRAFRAEGQQKRADNRVSSRDLLHNAGIQFVESNEGAHLIVQAARGTIVDFWPGTGLWRVRGKKVVARRGVQRLIDYCGKEP